MIFFPEYPYFTRDTSNSNQESNKTAQEYEGAMKKCHQLCHQLELILVTLVTSRDNAVNDSTGSGTCIRIQARARKAIGYSKNNDNLKWVLRR
jgi:hypothetical protein